jgi:predicted alpha/beta superfamily hydrolase
MVRSRWYFGVAAAGLVTAWVFNAWAVFDQADYLRSWFGSPVDWVLSIDLLLVIVTAATFMILEGRRLKMRFIWLYFVLSGLTAFAFTFPLFMAFRERALLRRALAGGVIEMFEFDGHRVDVWRPGKKLAADTPILVLHDGKNVLDPSHSTFGVSWGVLAAFSTGELRAATPPVVIAVWGKSDETRMRELAPEAILKSHPEFWQNVPKEWIPSGTQLMGDAYVSLVADAVLPFVAERYGLQPDPARTAIGGASMGGLASLYAMAERSKSYGTAICFSTHWSLGGNELVDELCSALPNPGEHRIWTDAGSIELDAEYREFHLRAETKLRDRGYGSRFNQDDLVTAILPNSGHSERYWARRLPDALNWWLRS